MVTSATPPLPEAGFARAARIRAFLEEHAESLRSQYPNQFVAVRDGQVIAANADLVMLVYELRDRGLQAHLDVDIEFIPGEERVLLL